MKLQVGKFYKTVGNFIVKIIDFEGMGRKPFLGELQSEDRKIIKYFRNGSFSNASRQLGGHPLDIREEISSTND